MLRSFLCRDDSTCLNPFSIFDLSHTYIHTHSFLRSIFYDKHIALSTHSIAYNLIFCAFCFAGVLWESELTPLSKMPRGAGEGSTTLVYPSGCREVKEDLSPDELIRRLKVKITAVPFEPRLIASFFRLWRTPFSLWAKMKVPIMNLSRWRFIWRPSTFCCTPARMFNCWLPAA